MSVRYTIPFKSADNSSWRIDISDISDTAIPVFLRALKGEVCQFAYDGDVDNPFTVVFKSTLSIAVYNQDNIDINELQNAQDKDFKVSLYEGASLKWIGYLLTEGIQRQLLSAPTVVNLSATDGLSMLNDIDYAHADLTGGRCPINYFRQILFATVNLGLPLPIRWTNSLHCTAYITEDVFAGSVRWSNDDQGFYSYQAAQSGGDTGTIKKCGEILEEMLRSMQCRIFQSEGKWVIRRVNDIVNGEFNYKQIAGDLGVFTIQSGFENVLKQIGRSGYSFVNKDALITTKQGLKSVTVEYDANVRDNIVPNGSQDAANPFDILYWGSYTSSPLITVEPSLDARKGNSARLIGTDPSDSYYSLISTSGTLRENGLPIDTETMIKIINFGFTFSLISGFPLLPGDVIDWSTEPFKIQVVFNSGDSQYFLNEFGFWQLTPVSIAIVVDGLQLNDVAKVDFDKFQGIIMPAPLTQPIAGETSDIQILFIVKNGQTYNVDNIYINIENSNDVYESSYAPSRNTSTDNLSLKISSSFGGYMVSNFMTSWETSDDECFFADGAFYEGTLTGLTANAMMRLRYKSSKIFNGTINVRNGNWTFDQIYLIDTFGTEKYLPLNAKYNVETCQVFLIAMECRNDQIELTEKYYSSNDKQLSN